MTDFVNIAVEIGCAVVPVGGGAIAGLWRWAARKFDRLATKVEQCEAKHKEVEDKLHACQQRESVMIAKIKSILNVLKAAFPPDPAKPHEVERMITAIEKSIDSRDDLPLDQTEVVRRFSRKDGV